MHSIWIIIAFWKPDILRFSYVMMQVVSFTTYFMKRLSAEDVKKAFNPDNLVVKE